MSALPQHPWLAQMYVLEDPFAAQSRNTIHWAADVLGFDYVNDRPFEWTRLTRENGLREMARFADAISAEAHAHIHAQQMQASVQEQARQAELQRLRRR